MTLYLSLRLLIHLRLISLRLLIGLRIIGIIRNWLLRNDISITSLRLRSIKRDIRYISIHRRVIITRILLFMTVYWFTMDHMGIMAASTATNTYSNNNDKEDNSTDNTSYKGAHVRWARGIISTPTETRRHRTC